MKIILLLLTLNLIVAVFSGVVHKKTNKKHHKQEHHAEKISKKQEHHPEKIAKKAKVEELKCQVSDWKDWNECKSHKGESLKKPLRTIHINPTTYDAGREWMSLMMQQKEKDQEYITNCRLHGTCPHLAPRKSSKVRENCINGMAGEWPCKNVDKLSFVDLLELGSTDVNPRANDIWGWTDTTTNDEYAIVGLSDGTSFVKVTDPENPQVLAFLQTRTVRSNWRDMKVINNHAFIISEAADHGMQIYDLTQLRAKSSFSYVTASAEYGEIGNSHNIVANEASNTLFIVGASRGPYPNRCNSGLHMVDVSDPKNPVFAGCFGLDGYVHDAECVFYKGPDMKYKDKEICFCYNEDTLTIVDVTTKAAAELISKIGYTGSRYTHQGWLLEDHSALLMDDEQDETNGLGDGRTITYFWDIESLENPILRNTYISSEYAIDHNQYIRDGYTYQSNYEAGLRILKINKAQWTLEEHAYFDVMPKLEGEVVFQGTWSNYPYFPSRNVIMTSIEYGLFVVRPHYDALPKADEKEGEQVRKREVVAFTDIKSCPNLFESRICKA